MIYKASLDNLAKIITAGIIILFIILGFFLLRDLINTTIDIVEILSIFFVLLLFIGIPLGCFMYAPVAYELNENKLVIHRRVNGKTILFSAISEVRKVEKQEMKGLFRTFGVGGLFGYFGRYWNAKFGNMIFYVTQRKNWILIKTKNGSKIVLTPDNIAFIEDLNQRIQEPSKNTSL